MLEAIIIDNEKPAIDILKILLERTGQVKVLKSFLSADDAFSSFPNLKPDVAFLDIEMPGTNGLELAEKLLAINSSMEIIFVTAYDQYALEAFRVNALDYLLKPISLDDVEQTIARVNKRKGSSLVSTEKSSYSGHIHCFGKLSVFGSINDKPVKWRTSKAEELFAFMLQNLNEEVSKWRICEELWPECDADKIDIHLHTTIYKMKKVLTDTGIKFDYKFINGCYKLSLSNISIDTAEFDSAVGSDIIITADNIDSYERAFSLYKGNYLEENGYIWALSKTEEYSNKYNHLSSSLVQYYMNNYEYSDAERILRTVLAKFPIDDFSNEMLLKLYFLKKDRAAFSTHYNVMKELYITELGIEPSKTMQALYKSMLNL